MIFEELSPHFDSSRVSLGSQISIYNDCRAHISICPSTNAVIFSFLGGGYVCDWIEIGTVRASRHVC